MRAEDSHFTMFKNILIPALVALVIAAGVSYAIAPKATETAFAGVTHLSGLYVGQDGETVGGGVLATTTVGTTFGTLSESQLLTNKLLSFAPGISSATTTIIASTSMTTLLANPGDTRQWVLANATSTAAKTVGIAGGTGIDIQSKTLNNVQIQPGGTATLECTRKTNTDVYCIIDPFVIAD